MLAILVQNDLKKIVTGQKPTDLDQSKCDELDEKALSAIQLCLMSTFIRAHISEFVTLVNDLKNAEANIDDEDQVSTTERSKLTSEWVLDLGCSYHMCPDKDWFSIYSSVKGEVVLMGNNSPCKIIGIGIIQIRMHNRTIIKLSDVSHVPNLKKNIISLGILDFNGCKIVIKSSDIKLYSMTIASRKELINLEQLSVPHSRMVLQKGLIELYLRELDACFLTQVEESSFEKKSLT
ncbi:hypothetical protein CXB51_034773 [Gossypium anomalum]|uniref:Retrovirus-related Pol polyprotein from transposon TNT 1-94-like beta-barrel domain-containing protein n=1 Tax=Gossypium anomalum TaxID=47600 RepID=A0A8J5XQ57_9ROSI|nr:hypothetical protein CXB51_034773 [Gossypium anomalum]